MSRKKKAITKINRVWLIMVVILSLAGIILLIFANSEYHGRHYKFRYSAKNTVLFDKNIDGEYIIIGSYDDYKTYYQSMRDILKQEKADKKSYEHTLKKLDDYMDEDFFKKRGLLLFYEYADVGSLNSKIMSVDKDKSIVYITLSKYSIGSNPSGITDIYLLPINTSDFEGVKFIYKENFTQSLIFSCILALPYIALFISVVNFLVRLYDSRLSRAIDIKRKQRKDAIVQLTVGIIISIVLYYVIIPLFLH